MTRNEVKMFQINSFETYQIKWNKKSHIYENSIDCHLNHAVGTFNYLVHELPVGSSWWRNDQHNNQLFSIYYIKMTFKFLRSYWIHLSKTMKSMKRWKSNNSNRKSYMLFQWKYEICLLFFAKIRQFKHFYWKLAHSRGTRFDNPCSQMTQHPINLKYQYALEFN